MQWAAVFLFAGAAVGAVKPVDFNREIRPILSDNCFSCHGPDETKRMAKLRLDTKDGALGVIKPGNAAESRLYVRVSAANKGVRMPPARAGEGLTAPQIATIKRWIEEGAPWQEHWAYVPPARPELPQVTNRKWARNPIDAFVLARLEKEGLAPAAEADRATLLRRVTLDVTGLPPTPEQVKSFLADKSAGAYEKRVDQLLQSPHYGERMAMQWLDLARYADTHGYHIDSHRDMWHWRDWVISAFQSNLPFDQFTIWQLAGDLLPNATREQKLATGFNRNHVINFEGGAIPEEYQTEYVIDRVEATSTVWMGTTMGCTRCHDHKYDPIRQKDFYRFFAFFNTIPEKGLDGRAGNAEPLLALPTAQQEAGQARLKEAIAAREKALPEAEVKAALEQWQQGAELADAPVNGLLAHYEFEGNLQDSSGHYRHGRLTTTQEPTFVPAQVHKGAEFGGEPQFELGDFDIPSEFAIAVWLRPTSVKENTVWRHRGYALYWEESAPIGDLQRGARLVLRAADGRALRTQRRLQLNQWHHVTLHRDQILVNGKPEPSEAVNAPGEPSKVGYKGRIDDLRFYGRRLKADEALTLAVRYPVREILSQIPARRSKEELQRVREYFMTYEAPAPLRTAYNELTALKLEQTKLTKAIETSMVMEEMPKPRESFILARGDYRNKTEKVTPGVPAFLPPLPAGVSANRLALAQWLVSPQHPLTARVAVNRYWQLYFGTGIVKTTEDFGSQGEAPTHPQLLDWLATEFVRTGWDIRAMQKLIVTSATYRQSSKVTPGLHERDPENRLFARGPRYRVPAEILRDNALYAAGLLDTDRIGGPSVLPYQPPGLWEEMAFGDVYSAQAYVQSHGRDLYRRSMYTFWKRTVPPASLATFDAPDREKCTARRSLTNTPLQALVLLNDPTYVEAARALAQRTLHEAGAKPRERIARAFELATARTPSKREVQVLNALLTGKLADYRRDPEAARKLLGVGESKADARLEPAELAAWTTVASVILNLDETITKE